MRALLPTTLRALLALLLSAPCLQAALIDTSVTTVVQNDNDDFDLTDLGTTDWAYWNNTADTGLSGAPDNSRLGGTAISDVFAVNGSGLRGSGGANKPTSDFTFTDGTSLAAGTVDNAIGIFNTSLRTANAGVGLTVKLPTLETYNVSVWVSPFATSSTQLPSATLTATLGATTYTDNTRFGGNGTPKTTFLYTFTVTPDNANDDFTVRYVLNNGFDNSSHVLISAAAVQVIPEPASLALCLIAFAGLWFARRKV